ncbi:hypothetical protein N7513_003260 [Penicillium frequentans]|nr:hypothetical protein N7513_003260 [Penicillium glabrum]
MVAVDIPVLHAHSLASAGEVELITQQFAARAGIVLCSRRVLSKSNEDNPNIIKVVYIVGTGTVPKVENMDNDMRRKLAAIQVTMPHIEIAFLGTYGLSVPSGEPEQPSGFKQGLNGAAGDTGRIGNSVSAVQKYQLGEISDVGFPQGLQQAINDADLHIFGGQEASPDMDAERPYDSNYAAYYLATECNVKQSERYCMVKSPGLELVVEAFDEALKRNQDTTAPRDWTHGKVLNEWDPKVVPDPKDWHRVLSRDRMGRFDYSDMGYQEMRLPEEWFKLSPGAQPVSQ